MSVELRKGVGSGRDRKSVAIGRYAAPMVQHCALIPIGLLAMFLSVWRLDSYSLWQDEAQTALLGRSVVKEGVPLAYDGKNNCGQEQDSEYDEHYRWRWHPWLPFYIVAGVFATCGESTFNARLPFALFGAATVVGTYLLAWVMWRDRRAALAAALMLTLSVPFLILTRQCRYYSAAAFFTVISLVGYWYLMAGKRLGAALCITAVLCLFYTQFVFAYTLMAALAVHAILWHRDRMKALAVCGGVIACACLPGALWFSGAGYFTRYGAVMFEWTTYWRNMLSFVSQLEQHVFAFWLLNVPTVSVALHYMRGTFGACFNAVLWRGLSCIVVVSAVNVAVFSCVVPAPFFRYIVVLIPLAAILIGRIALAAGRWHWAIAVVVVACSIGRGPLLDFVYELTHEFRGPNDGIVAYLRANAREEDVVGVTYEDLPIKFYTSLRVVGGFTGEKLSPEMDLDWIILHHHVVEPVKEAPVRDFLTRQLRTGHYERIVLEYPDTKWQNREDPATHLFRTAVSEPPVVLWRRVCRSSLSK